MSVTDEADVRISVATRARELRMLEGVAAILDVASIVTRHSGDADFSEQNRRSLAKVLATAGDLLQAVRSEMAMSTDQEVS